MGSDSLQYDVQVAAWQAIRRVALTVVLLGLLLAGPRVQGQDFFLTLTNTPDPIMLGSNITYSLTVSNATGENLNPGIITSEYGTNAEFILATNRYGITNLPGLVIFEVPLNAFPANGVINVFLELRGTNVGQLTNTFSVEIFDDGRTTPVTNTAVSSIQLPPEADLGISILGPTNGVFPGDSFRYQLIATNAGPDTVPDVIVSNLFPSNIRLLGLGPSNSVEQAGDFILFSVGTLTNLGSATATISVLATNAAQTNLISATITAPLLGDTNNANNSVTDNVPILTPNTNQIIVASLSAQVLNPQTGWMEQRVLLTNVSASGVDSVRLLVGGMTNQLINVTGTNGTTPYVAHGAALEPSGTLELILEYSNSSRIAGADPALTAYGTPQLDLTPQDGSGQALGRIVRIGFTNLNQGRMLLEWTAKEGAQYQVIYDEHVTFTNAVGSLPMIITPPQANQVQWLDYGPPRTLSAPSNSASRFYKVIELP